MNTLFSKVNMLTATILAICTSIVNAGSINYSQSFNQGDILTQNTLNTIFGEVKSAVDDNDVKINTIFSSACAVAGDVMTGIDTNGNPTCITPPTGNGGGSGDITSVTVGSGLIILDANGGLIGDVVLGIDTAVVQTEAQNAMGPTLNSNPLNHDRFTSQNAISAVQSLLDQKQIVISGTCNAVSQKMVGVLPSGAVECAAEDKHSMDAVDGIPANQLFIDTVGEVGIGTNTPDSLLHINTDGSKWNTRLNEGDFKIGSATHRYKIGVALNGAGAGDVRISADGGTSRLVLTSATKDIMHVNGNGVVVDPIAEGIGNNSLLTIPPSLYVRGNKNEAANLNAHIMIVENTNNASTGSGPDGLAIVTNRPVAVDASSNFISFINVNGGVQTALGAVEGNSATGGVTFKTLGGDYAEWLQKLNRKESLQPGDIVGMTGGKVSKNTLSVEKIMVVSNTAIVAGNYPGASKEGLYALTAFIGQVDAKVKGLVNTNDYIIASGLHDGVGVAVSPSLIAPDQFPLVVGRAWASSDNVAVKKIRISVGLTHQAPITQRMYKTLNEQQQTINTQALEIQRLKLQMTQLDSVTEQLNILKTQFSNFQNKDNVVQASLSDRGH